MSEMVERVARAIDPTTFSIAEDFGGPDGRDEVRAQARAAIEAMKDPPLEILQAMFEAMFEDKWDGTQAVMIGAGFDAAIDAALTDGGE